MARLFDDASTEYLTHSAAVVSTYPITMAAWFYPDAFVNQTLVSISDTAAYLDYFELRLRDPADSDIIALIRRDSQSFAKTTASYTLNTWHHAVGVFAAANDLRIFLNGGNKGTEVGGSETPAGMDTTSIGVLKMNTLNFYMSGRIAEVGIWNVALTDAEVAILADGFSPLFVHPQNLVAYWPLVRGLNDRVGGYNMTATGTTVSAHSRLIYPAAPMIITAPVVAAPGEGIPIPIIMNYYRQLRN